MAYRFAECGDKRFVSWDDLAIEINGITIKIYDKSEPDVCIEHTLDIFSPLDDSIESDGAKHKKNPGTNYYNNSFGQINGKVPTWLIPTEKPSDNIDGLATIWCPTS